MSCQTPLLVQIGTSSDGLDSSPEFADIGEEQQFVRGGLFKTWETPSSSPSAAESSLYESYLSGAISGQDMRRARNSCEHFLTQFEELGYDIEEIDESMDYTPQWPQSHDFSFNLHPQASPALQSLRPFQSPPHIINQHLQCRQQKKQLSTKISQLQLQCRQLRAAEGEIRGEVQRWRVEGVARMEGQMQALVAVWEGRQGEIRRQAEEERRGRERQAEEVRGQLAEAISANQLLSEELTKSDENQRTLAGQLVQLEEELAVLQEQSEQLFTRNCELQRDNLRLSVAEEELVVVRGELEEQRNYVADLEEKVADLEYEQMRQMGNLESELMEYRDSMEEEFRSRWAELRGIFEHGERVRVEIEAAHLEGLEVEAAKLRELMSIKSFLEERIQEVTQGYERSFGKWRHEGGGGREAGTLVEVLRSVKQSVVCLFRSKESVFWTNHESLSQINTLYRQLHAYFRQNCFSHPNSRILERVSSSDRPPLSDSTFHSLNTTPPSKSQDNFCLQTQSTCIAEPPPPHPWGHLENSLFLITHRLQDVRQRLRDSLSASCP